MDTAPVEAVLNDIGKAFRLCRFYPSSHPSVQQALASLSVSLPALARVGTIELKLQPSGMILGAAPLAPRNTQIQELARLLYTQGHRVLVLEPGLTADEVARLIRSAASGTERAMQTVGGKAEFEALPHIRLERTARKPGRTASRPSAESPADAPVLGRRVSQVFRPDALPPQIECTRLAAQLESRQGDEAMIVDRLAQLLPELAEQRDFKHLTILVRALAKLAVPDGGPLERRAAQLLEAQLTPAALAGILGRLTQPGLTPDDRDAAVQALGALGARAIPAVFDACLVAGPEERDILLAVVRRAGRQAAGPILARMDPDARGEIAATTCRLLGATRSPDVTLMLGSFAMHAEPQVRRVAIEELSHLDDPEAVRHLFAGLRDADPAVRATAARGVGWLGDASQVPVLVARLHDEADDDAAIALIRALGELRDPRAVVALAELARGVSGVFQRYSPAVRVAAIHTLGLIGSPEAVEAVRAEAGSRHPEVRQAVQDALRLVVA